MITLETVAIIVGVVSGVTGLLLGILNQKHQRYISRPRLVVKPCVFDFYDSNTGEIIAKAAGVMEICNIGQMPVYGSKIGFRARRGLKEILLRRGAKAAYIVKNPEPVNGVPWPGELKPQHTALFRFDLDSLPDTKKLGSAIAYTIVGDTFTASKRDMRKFNKDRMRHT